MTNVSISTLRDVDLNLLHTFRAFVRAGGVDAAARALGRSQPAISVRLHRLESELGVTLFEQVGRRLQLTAVGRMVDQQLDPIFGALVDLLDHARAEAPIGRLRLGVLPTVGVYVLAPALAKLRRRHAGITIELHHGAVSDHVHALAAGDLDAVAGVGRPPGVGLSISSLGVAAPVLVTPRGDRLARRRSVRARHLADRSLVGFGRTGDDFFDAIDDYFSEHDLHGQIGIRAAHIQTLKALVQRGAGLAILPDYTIRDTNLAAIAIADLQLRQTIWIATRSSRHATPIMAALVECARTS